MRLLERVSWSSPTSRRNSRVLHTRWRLTPTCAALEERTLLATTTSPMPAVGAIVGATTTATTTPTTVAISEFYRVFLHRDAEPDGLNFWTAQAAAGVSLNTIGNAIANSQESRADIVTIAGENFLGRVPSSTEVQAGVAFSTPAPPSISYTPVF